MRTRRGNMRGGMVVAVGLLLCLAAMVLLLNVGGAADVVMKRVTSQPLGELAPGFAATRRGFNTYAALVLAIGMVALGLGVAGWYLPIGESLIVFGGITFAGASVIAIAGEVEAYRALEREASASAGRDRRGR